MKKFLILILAVTLGISATDAQQLSKREIKAQKKALQQEIAGYQAQGWTVAPGNLSMAEQITRSKSFITAMDENNEAKYVIAEATTTAETHKAAMQSAQSAVKLAAANTIHGEIMSLTETSLANSEEAALQAVSVDEFVTAAKELVAASLPRGILLISMYREVGNNVQLRLMYAYDYAKVLDSAKAATRQTLQDKIDKLHNKLN
ncbi:MAG: hypothetical protein IIX42_02910 [Alistipes sp.]|jgi:hypothetical protein|nr:hypothetical protein [Alistipes sp.]MBQ6584086.1 hypothetical protein [Alistipes sp.]MBR2116757.1 hypothetical protein [Alistipes sp.]